MNSTGVVTTIVRAEGIAASFLADAMKLVIGKGLVSDQRFVEIVPPKVLAQHLANFPEHRADILLEVHGISIKAARASLAPTFKDMDVDLVDKTLRRILDEKSGAASTIRGAVACSDWSRILSAHLLWKFISYGDWYKKAWADTRSVDMHHEDCKRGPALTDPSFKALEEMLKLLDKYELITPTQKYDQLSLEELIRLLPRNLKDGALKNALRHGENESKPFKAVDLFTELATVHELVLCMESSVLWEKLVLYAASQQGWLLETALEEAPPETVVRVPRKSGEDGGSGDQPDATESAIGAAQDASLAQPEVPPENGEDGSPPTRAGLGTAMGHDTTGIFDAAGAKSTAAPPSGDQPEDGQGGGERSETHPDVTSSISSALAASEANDGNLDDDDPDGDDLEIKVVEEGPPSAGG